LRSRERQGHDQADQHSKHDSHFLLTSKAG
jgi:hypothetical protein